MKIKNSSLSIYTQSILLLLIIFSFIFPTLAKANEFCRQGLFFSKDMLIRISKNIYLSTDKKLYQEQPCESYITETELKEQIDHYISLNEKIDNLQRSITYFSTGMYINNDDSWGDSKFIEIQNRLSNIEMKIPNIRSIFNTYLKKKNIDSLEIREQSVGMPEESNVQDVEDTSPNRLFLNDPIEISPTYYKKFVELDREPTLKELLGIKRYLLGEIDSQLNKRYKLNYYLIENNDSQLRVEIKNLNREVTNSKWEILELTMTPIISDLNQIDIQISAILRTKSGIGNKPPEEKSFRYSEEHKALQNYVNRLITYLKEEIVFTDFKLQ